MNLTPLEFWLILAGVAALAGAGGFFGALSATRRKYLSDGRREGSLEERERLDERLDERLEAFREGPESKALLELEYRKGLADGRSATLKDFSVTIEPYKEVKDYFVVKICDYGYQTQLSYGGFPIGEPMRRSVEKGKYVVKENVEYIVEKVEKAARLALDVYASKGLDAKIVGQIRERLE